MKLLFETSVKGRKGVSLPALDVPRISPKDVWNDNLLRSTPPELPELGELDVVRHFTKLSNRNFGVDSGFYPLGSCTMKYNPKINEEACNLYGFGGLHPLLPDEMAQGALEVIYRLERYLCEIAGMKRATLQPAAGAHGELTGVMLIKAYHKHKGNDKKKKMLIPDSAHGTNPASAALAGFEIVEIKSDARGNVDMNAFRSAIDDETAGVMLTNPSTLGLFDENIVEIARLLHEVDALLYYDGANLNAVMGYCRPGDMGFDVIHYNLHKTFATPHGGGGPGSGPIAVSKRLEPYLPIPVVELKDGKYLLDYERSMTIGRLLPFNGNFAVMLRAFVYILSVGGEGLKAVSEDAVLNANYLRVKLAKRYTVAFDRVCMHEFVLNNSDKAEKGAPTLAIAKRLLDYGIHPPTIYFPLIVKEAMMIEPTETESLDTLDRFVNVMMQIADEIETNPELLQEAPVNTPVRKLDEVRASRKPVFRYQARQE